ncbi:MAG: peptide-methionine (S)-S-oxide reductase MsrA [Gammaproteobacteria bacterium]|nr:peptide-methionine (S)-S-oxide reductase MsrA [Gammaproteobacteria bacterium]MDH5801645.1 peptide-methionine (S)-S-oxide reductase MsrA [Gammaproteobacteria bacterium]
MKPVQILLILIGAFCLSSQALAAKAVFAGGCFWCMESDFEKLMDKGVIDVVSGFTGGTLKNPTYNGDHSGHYEAIEVTYDPARISYQQLLDYFWVQIDPFDDKGQFCDKGHAYLSAIFVANDKERQLAEKSRRKVVAQFPNQKVVTPVLDAAIFYPIKGKENYHQNYYKNNPVRYNYYRYSCGRDKRLKQIWGDKTTH